MFSRSYHHHQDAGGTIPGLLASQPGWTGLPDHHTAHHIRLETILDSALATLALLHESHHAPTFSAHITEVLVALNKYILRPAAHSAPTPTPISSTTSAAAAHDDATPAPMYSCHGRDLIPRDLTTTQRERSRASRLIIRFDPNDPHPPKYADPLALYSAIDMALPTQTSQLSGIQWTRKGNLVLHARPGICTAKLLAAHDTPIWNAIRPLLGFTVKEKCPVFEIDEPWHAVVFHGVPMPPSREPYAFTLAGVRHWLGTNEPEGAAMAFSVLCTVEDFATRDSLSVRVSLSSEADALRLLKNGGTFYGAMCRVSRYVSKTPPRAQL
ncbi:hypothetical protein B0H17DRAFT_1218679 [Mycena rosella]|uniref:Uncharacterized protein n=1 Tax=Mycena rosella TaxID=1033263 RepID=A0AAD7BNX8_MYCRO|nr:hypothetical protein B0H17DRAFT_1218679 [Mycena rosella]